MNPILAFTVYIVVGREFVIVDTLVGFPMKSGLMM